MTSRTLPIVMAGCIWADAQFSAGAATTSLTIPNAVEKIPDCLLVLPDKLPDCAVERCELPYRHGPALHHVILGFGCAPISSPSGFENPPADVKVDVVKARNVTGMISYIEDITEPKSQREMEVTFCIFGKSIHACGFAKIPKEPASVNLKQTRVIKRFIRGLALYNTPVKKR